MNRRFLVVVRAGDASLHPQWLTGDRTFDLVCDYYGGTPGKWAGHADVYLENRGAKWPGLEALLARNPHWLRDYEAVWFPDDDLETTGPAISAMFALHAELGLGLSQPALAPDSYHSHLISLQHQGFSVRYTNFVEAMAPLFSAQALRSCRPLFSQSLSGWGLDLAWSSVLAEAGHRLAVFDCLPVRHTRPVGGGELYRNLDLDPGVEMMRVACTYGVPLPYRYRVHGALDEAFAPVPTHDLPQRLSEGFPRPSLQDAVAKDRYAGDLHHDLTLARHRVTTTTGVAG